MIPEFLGRLPIVCAVDELDKDMLIKVLSEPKNAILKQYEKLLEFDGNNRFLILISDKM